MLYFKGCRFPRGFSSPCLRGELGTAGFERLFLRVANLRIGGIQLFQGFHDHIGYEQTGIPLFVRRNNIPGRRLGRGLVDRLFVGVHICIPIGPLRDIGSGKFPVFRRCVDAGEEAAALFLLGDVEKKLDHRDPVFGQIRFKIPDLAVPPVPQAVVQTADGQFLRIREVVNLRDQHLLVIRAVENADIPPFGQAAVDPPEVIVVKFLRRGLFEAADLYPLGIEAAHHVFDRAVLASRIHGLENQQQSVPVLRVEAVLEFGHLFHVFPEQGEPFFLAQPAVLVGVECGDGKAAFLGEAIGCGVQFSTLLSDFWR